MGIVGQSTQPIPSRKCLQPLRQRAGPQSSKQRGACHAPHTNAIPNGPLFAGRGRRVALVQGPPLPRRPAMRVPSHHPTTPPPREPRRANLATPTRTHASQPHALMTRRVLDRASARRSAPPAARPRGTAGTEHPLCAHCIQALSSPRPTPRAPAMGISAAMVSLQTPPSRVAAVPALQVALRHSAQISPSPLPTWARSLAHPSPAPFAAPVQEEPRL